MRIGAVVNPVAGGGRMKREWPAIAAALRARLGEVEVRTTAAPGDAPCLAEALVAGGCDLVIAGGGDGTISEVADGILKARDETGSDAALALAPCGTGNDIARMLGAPTDPGRIAAAIASGAERRLDAGRLSFVDDAGCLRFRYFLNIASLGISGAIDRAVNAAADKGRFSAKALFYWRTVVELIRFRFPTVRIAIDDEPPVEAAIALVAAANGPCFGGGMRIAPDADNADGLFDIVIVRASGKFGLIRDLRLIYCGAHLALPIVSVMRGRRLTVEPLGPADAPLLDIDGESPGRAPATFEILPAAIRVRC